MLTWIKTHPAQSALVALSLSATVSTVQLYQESVAFRSSLSTPSVSPPSKSEVANPAQATLDRALALSQSPGTWDLRPDAARLFTSEIYARVGERLEKPAGGMFHPPVPNIFLLKHGLDPFDPNVLRDDPDKDGFSTWLEWCGKDAAAHLLKDGTPARPSLGAALPDDSTNPVDASAHPPYHTRLVTERIEQIPFHLQFLGHDENAQKRGEVTVQINANSGRTEYVVVGNALEKAPIEVRSFTEKYAPGPDGTKKDVSEIVIYDRRTKQEIILPKGQAVNSPESYTILRYDWEAPGAAATEKQRFRLRSGETFRLPPENSEYRVTKIGIADVEIATPDGATWIVAAAPR